MKKSSLFFLMFPIFMFGQTKSLQDYTNYYTLISEANLLQANEKYNKALEKYEVAFSINYPFPDDIGYAIDCAIVLKDELKVKQLICLLVKSGYKKKNNKIYFKGRFFNGDSEFKYPNYQFFLDSIYQNKRIEYLKEIDEEANKYLDAYNLLEAYTTGIRTFRNEYNESTGAYCALRKSFNNLVSSDIDISRKKTDVWNDNTFLAALIHMTQAIEDNDYNKDNIDSEFMDNLKKMMIEGNIHILQYAAFYDQYKKYDIDYTSYYGTMMEIDTFTNERIFTKIYDKENLDKRRVELGLPPLWVTAKLKNIGIAK